MTEEEVVRMRGKAWELAVLEVVLGAENESSQ